MSYEITNASNKICSNNEIESNFYIFEIRISTFDDCHDIYRKISYKNEGILLETDNNIKTLKITMCRINNINNLITIQKQFNSPLSKPTILYKENLIITLESEMNQDTHNLISLKYIVAM
jgi:hypothetical protein